eukprot:gene8284-8471_t
MAIRATGDQDTTAQVLLLQARLAALAAQPEEAVKLVQAAQAAGGGVGFWRDSIMLYAAVRGSMRGSGPADAQAALEGGIGLMDTIARHDIGPSQLTDVLDAV